MTTNKSVWNSMKHCVRLFTLKKSWSINDNYYDCKYIHLMCKQNAGSSYPYTFLWYNWKPCIYTHTHKYAHTHKEIQILYQMIFLKILLFSHFIIYHSDIISTFHYKLTMTKSVLRHCVAYAAKLVATDLIASINRDLVFKCVLEVLQTWFAYCLH